MKTHLFLYGLGIAAGAYTLYMLLSGRNTWPTDRVAVQDWSLALAQMKALLAKFGLTVDSFLKSTLTLLIFFALVAVVAWFAMKKHVPAYMAGGFGLAAFYFLIVNAKNNGGSQGDTVFSGGLADIVNSGRTGDIGGTLRDPNLYNTLGSDLGL